MKKYLLLTFILSSSDSYAGQKYTTPNVVKSSESFPIELLQIPKELDIDTFEYGVFVETTFDEHFTLFNFDRKVAYTHESGIFVERHNLCKANRAALFLDLSLTQLGANSLCSYSRSNESPQGYYLSPALVNTYHSDLQYQGVLFESSIRLINGKLLFTLVNKDDPNNYIQIRYLKE